MPPIWAVQCPSNIYKANKTDCLFPQTERDKDSDVSRKYVVPTLSEVEACGNQKPGPRPVGEPGFLVNYKKFKLEPSSTNPLIRLQD